MRKWILNLHLYLGLLCSPYLLIYGLSSLNFNHPLAFTQPSDRIASTWTREIEYPRVESKSRENIAKATYEQLGLFGWVHPWSIQRDAEGNLHFTASRPGKEYAIDARYRQGHAEIAEKHTGLWTIIRNLHGLGEAVPGTRWLSTWNYFTEVTNWVVLFSAATGVYLWTYRRHERAIGWIMLLGAGALSLGMMMYVTLHG
ncbi:MAG: hypothetical protein IT443_06410 [Phycisphaeraceae bacterium]|nr:hypothetical protein [Phycisphaeraceae bacterium]